MGNYNAENDVVIVAETQLKLSAYEANNTLGTHTHYISKFSMHFAGYDWALTMALKDASFCRVHLELVLCDEKLHRFSGFPIRHRFTTHAPTWLHLFEDHRSWEQQQQPPDFTSPKVQFGNLASNGKLRVGQCVFHVNKELLALHSPYFNTLFNNPNFDEAKQDIVELKGETETKDPALFHDFLCAMLPNMNFLPNVKNVAGLLALAQFYQVDSVRDKCVNCLKFAREMPAIERLALAKQYGLNELEPNIMKEQKTLKAKDALLFASLEL